MTLPSRLRDRVAELDGWLRDAGDTRLTTWRLDRDGWLRCLVRDRNGARYEVSATQGAA